MALGRVHDREAMAHLRSICVDRCQRSSNAIGTCTRRKVIRLVLNEVQDPGPKYYYS